MTLRTILSQHALHHPGLVKAAEIPRLPVAVDNYALLGFRDIYATVGVIGLRIGERARTLAGHMVRIRGYMAPPIAGRDRFFAVTRSPVAACPFCNPDARWPDDIVLACLEDDSQFVDPAQPIEVVGQLEIGAKPDPRTAVPRLVRLTEARWQPIGP